MALVTISFSDLQGFVRMQRENLDGSLAAIGVPLEKFEGDEVCVEITPNRPDLLSVEGLGRALASFSGRAPPSYAVKPSGIKATIDPSVRDIRPFVGFALVRNVCVTDALVKSMMQLQEKLHDTMGRKRKKVAIGLHDAGKVSPPFRYVALPQDALSFVPLDSNEKMTFAQILQKHPKGKEFAHLVGALCPVILDSQQNVLSFPPIINGELTRVDERTKNILIDATGSSAGAVCSAISIIAAALADRGGQVFSVQIGAKEYPVLQSSKRRLPLAAAKKLLGIELSKKDAQKMLLKLGHPMQGDFVLVPAFRADIMDDVDLIEDIAIAYGYNNFEPSMPSFASVGKSVPSSPLHELLVGLGFLEANSWLLSNKQLLSKANISAQDAPKISNPLTSDFTLVRPSILQNALAALSESKNEKLPQKLYELGTVANPSQKEHLCAAITHPKASFSEIKSLFECIKRELMPELSTEPAEYAPFIKGRCAAILKDGKTIGYFGEISPSVLESFSLEQPVCALEMEAS